MDQLGKLVIVAGFGVALVGALLWGLSRFPGARPGQMPGDFTFSLRGGWGVLTLVLLIVGLVRR